MRLRRSLHSPRLAGLLALAGLILVATYGPSATRAATPSFGSATVVDRLYITDEKNQLLKHNIPNLLVLAGGQLRNADFKSHFEKNGGLERWGLPISEVFEEEGGALTQYYQRGVVDFHSRPDLGGAWILERRLTWDYMGGGAGGSTDMKAEEGITNPNAGTLIGDWGHKISNFDIQGKTTGFRDFFDRLGGVQSFGFPKTDARLDTGAPGTLLARGSTPGIVRQYFQAAVLEYFPQNPAPYKVLLTLLGDFLRDATYPDNRWATLTPFLAAVQSTKGGTMTLVAVDRSQPTVAPSPTAGVPSPTPTTTPTTQVDVKKQLIVIGTRTKGISFYDGTAWKTVNVENSALGSNRISALFVDSQRRLWVGTDAGLFRLNDDLTVGPAYRLDNSGIGENNVTAISGQSPGTIWIGHGEKGASSYTVVNTQSPWARYRTDSSSIPSNGVRDLYMQDIGQNRVWIATAAGAARFDGSTNEWRILNTTSGLASNDILAVAIGADGMLWFGTNGAGLSSTPSGVAGSWSTYTTANGLGSNVVRDIRVGADGTVWVATAGGVSRKGPADLTFSTFNDLNSGLVNNDVRAIAQDSAGELWFTSANGVSRYNPTTRLWTTFRTGEGLAENDALTVVIVPKA